MNNQLFFFTLSVVKPLCIVLLNVMSYSVVQPSDSVNNQKLSQAEQFLTYAHSIGTTVSVRQKITNTFTLFAEDAFIDKQTLPQTAAPIHAAAFTRGGCYIAYAYNTELCVYDIINQRLLSASEERACSYRVVAIIGCSVDNTLFVSRLNEAKYRKLVIQEDVYSETEPLFTFNDTTRFHPLYPFAATIITTSSERGIEIVDTNTYETLINPHTTMNKEWSTVQSLHWSSKAITGEYVAKKYHFAAFFNNILSTLVLFLSNKDVAFVCRGIEPCLTLRDEKLLTVHGQLTLSQMASWSKKPDLKSEFRTSPAFKVVDIMHGKYYAIIMHHGMYVLCNLKEHTCSYLTNTPATVCACDAHSGSLLQHNEIIYPKKILIQGLERSLVFDYAINAYLAHTYKVALVNT